MDEHITDRHTLSNHLVDIHLALGLTVVGVIGAAIWGAQRAKNVRGTASSPTRHATYCLRSHQFKLNGFMQAKFANGS
jgi:hypothetical protein